MINALTYKNAISELLVHLYDSQKDNIEATARSMAKCIEEDGIIHVFGSGHSVGMGIDISNRVGCLVPIHVIETQDAVILGNTSLEEFSDKVNKFERRPGVADYFYNLYDIRKQDIFFVISNSGINGVGIDFAAMTKQKGNKVIVITSMQHTLSEDSRHPSGKKLYEYGDIVIDNCGPRGDALLETNGIEKVCSVSSICNNAIAQMAAARTVEILKEDNYPLPVLTGDKKHDDEIIEHYKGRI